MISAAEIKFCHMISDILRREKEVAMGGHGSGRGGAGPTVESARTLNINELLRDGTIKPGEVRQRLMSWSNPYNGEVTFEVVMIANLADPDAGYLRLVHLGRRGEIADYRVRFTTTDQKFGGRRWWFCCPHLGSRVATLHLPPGGDIFAGRKAWGLAYRSQRSSPRDRALERGFAIRRRLGADLSPMEPVMKPHRMRWATFEQHMADLAKADRATVALSMFKLRAFR